MILRRSPIVCIWVPEKRLWWAFFRTSYMIKHNHPGFFNGYGATKDEAKRDLREALQHNRQFGMWRSI